jgi:hypothetical protein
MSADSKSAKKTDSLTVYFAVLGYARVKAVRKMLVKSTPGFLPDNSLLGKPLKS